MWKRSMIVVLAIASVVGLAAFSAREFNAAPPSAVDGPGLTVYTGNLALVRHRVERELGPGTHMVRVDGLPTNLDASSLVVLNVGVTLLGTHGLRSYQDAGAGPGASLDLDLAVERRVDGLELAYLTRGLTWSAGYAMIVAADDASARVDGYATVVNGSGTGYSDAEVQLMAGTIQGSSGRGFEAGDMRMARAMAEAAAPAELQQAGFADYHLYTISTPVSLRAGESRRIRMLGASAVKVRKDYIFSYRVSHYQQSPEPVTQPVAVSYFVERGERTEFSDTPLPAGQVRVLQRDDAGRIQLLGVAGIANTPAREDLRLSTGYAFDIVGTRVQTDFERVASDHYQSTWKVEIRNRKDTDVLVQVIEQMSGDWRIVESSHDYETLSAAAVRFMVRVPAGEEAVLEYRISVRT